MLKLASANKQARKLQLTAVKPKAYGYGALGASPSIVKALRTTIGRGLNVKKAGGCLTTALALHRYTSRDPLITFSIENVIYFVQAAQDLPRHNLLGIDSVWPSMTETLEPKRQMG